MRELTERSRRWVGDPHLRFALLAFLVGRLVVGAVAAIGWQLPHETPEYATEWAAQPPAHAWQAFFTGLERFDGQFYLQVASEGYEKGDASSAFFPLYPLLVRAVGVLIGGHWLLAATLVSSVALVVALTLLQKLTQRELGHELAGKTVVLLLAFPVAFFLYAPYAEALFLALSLGCFFYLRTGRWAAASVTAALASATRISGITLGAAIAIEAMQASGWWPRDRPAWLRLLRGLGCSCGALAGVAAYITWWGLQGSWHEPILAMSRDFDRHPSLPWNSLWQGMEQVRDTIADPLWLGFTVETGLGIGACVLGAVAVRRFAPAYGAFVITGLLQPLLTIVHGQPLTSVARYDMVLFPLFWVLAQTLQRPLAFAAYLALSSSFLCVLTIYFAAWHDVL
jgi:hypothetical protein